MPFVVLVPAVVVGLWWVGSAVAVRTTTDWDDARLPLRYSPPRGPQPLETRISSARCRALRVRDSLPWVGARAVDLDARPTRPSWVVSTAPALAVLSRRPTPGPGRVGWTEKRRGSDRSDEEAPRGPGRARGSEAQALSSLSSFARRGPCGSSRRANGSAPFRYPLPRPPVSMGPTWTSCGRTLDTGRALLGGGAQCAPIRSGASGLLALWAHAASAPPRAAPRARIGPVTLFSSPIVFISTATPGRLGARGRAVTASASPPSTAATPHQAAPSGVNPDALRTISRPTARLQASMAAPWVHIAHCQCGAMS